jgi:hypothetical protein
MYLVSDNIGSNITSDGEGGLDTVEANVADRMRKHSVDLLAYDEINPADK